MRTVAIGAADIIAPVFAAAEIVVTLFTGVATEAGLRDLFRVLTGKRDDLSFVAGTFDVQFAWTMARFAALGLVFPTGNFL